MSGGFPERVYSLGLRVRNTMTTVRRIIRFTIRVSTTVFMTILTEIEDQVFQVNDEIFGIRLKSNLMEKILSQVY